MPIYKLEPIDRAHHDWKRSGYCGPCHVTARTAEMARVRAADEFHTACMIVLGEPIPLDPWTNGTLVRCTEVRHLGELPPDGMVEIPVGSEWHRYQR